MIAQISRRFLPVFQLIEFNWTEYLAPSLERLCAICRDVDMWLSDPDGHLTVLHCKGERYDCAFLRLAFITVPELQPW